MGQKNHYQFNLILLFILGLVFVITITQVQAVQSQQSLPNLKTHSLPEYLASATTNEEIGDYFTEIKTTPVGYLIWTQFPLKVYLEKPIETDPNIATVRRFLKWQEIIKQGIKEWSKYLPITEVEGEELADIIIKRNAPPLKPKFNPETGLFDFPPATTAETKYKFYLSKDNPPLLLHKMTIIVSPNLADDSILSAIRHELGHALGIWGHSDRPTDALYYSQVRDTPPISPRDINTLKKIYQQPTKLGWSINLN
jgi:predicted Zn-dependent protease